MPSPHQIASVTANNSGSVTLAFTYRVSHIIVWSAADGFYLGFDEAALTTTPNYLINEIYVIPIGMKTLGIRLDSVASADVEVIGIYFGEGVHDEQVQENRGGIHVSPIPTYF